MELKSQICQLSVPLIKLPFDPEKNPDISQIILDVHDTVERLCAHTTEVSLEKDESVCSTLSNISRLILETHSDSIILYLRRRNSGSAISELDAVPEAVEGDSRDRKYWISHKPLTSPICFLYINNGSSIYIVLVYSEKSLTYVVRTYDCHADVEFFLIKRPGICS